MEGAWGALDGQLCCRPVLDDICWMISAYDICAAHCCVGGCCDVTRQDCHHSATVPAADNNAPEPRCRCSAVQVILACEAGGTLQPSVNFPQVRLLQH